MSLSKFFNTENNMILEVPKGICIYKCLLVRNPNPLTAEKEKAHFCFKPSLYFCLDNDMLIKVSVLFYSPYGIYFFTLDFINVL